MWNELTYLKRKKLIKKIGFSFNEISEVEKMNELNIIPDIVQIPYNIFDRRFSKIILDLSNRGVEIHTRSSFLQGLFFISPDKLSNKHNVFKRNIIELKKISDKFGLSIEHLALSFCLSNKYIDRVLIGVHNLSQLKNNLQALKNPINDEIINELKDLSLGNHNIDYDSHFELANIVKKFTEPYARTDETHDINLFEKIPESRRISGRAIEVGQIFYFGT